MTTYTCSKCHTVQTVPVTREGYWSWAMTCKKCGTTGYLPIATTKVVPGAMSAQTERRLHALRNAAEQLDQAREDRNELIRYLALDGLTLRQIAEAADLSPAGVKKILDRPA